MIQYVSLRNSADTIRLGIDLNKCDAQIDRFRYQTTDAESGVVQYRHNPKTFGITSISCVPDAGKVVIETSAKILGNDYREGVHLGNLDQYADAISQSGVLSVSADALFDADTYRIDPNQTIELSKNPSDAVNALMLLNVQGRKYNFKSHTGGIVIDRKAKSRNDRIVMYNKRDELLLAGNKDFLIAYPKVLNTFQENSFRVEWQLRKLLDIRQTYQTNDTKLGNVLKSKANPVHQMFGYISKDYNTIITKIVNMSDDLIQANKIAFVMLHDCNMDAIRASVNRLTNSRNQRRIKEYQEIITKLESDKGKKQGYDLLINEIEQRLSEAV